MSTGRTQPTSNTPSKQYLDALRLHANSPAHVLTEAKAPPVNLGGWTITQGGSVSLGDLHALQLDRTRAKQG